MSRRVLGAVLAGGASSRFGSDKALARIGEATLLDLADATLAPWVDAIVVVGRAGGVPDRPEAGLGPLGGIAGALAWGREQGFESVMTVGCDMPAVPKALLSTLRAAAPAYCRDAPVLGHWLVSATDDLVRLLEAATGGVSTGSSVSPSDRYSAETMAPLARIDPPAAVEPRRDRRNRNRALSVRRWAEAIGATAVPSPGPLGNVNTPADLPAA